MMKPEPMPCPGPGRALRGVGHEAPEELLQGILGRLALRARRAGPWPAGSRGALVASRLVMTLTTAGPCCFMSGSEVGQVGGAPSRRGPGGLSRDCGRESQKN